MRCLIHSICWLALLIPAEMPQTAVTPPAFEVASIRPNPGPWHEMLGFYSSGPNLRLIAWDVKSLIMEAYNLLAHEVVYPSTATLDVDRYDIAAKAEGDFSHTRQEFRQMLQSLLTDRFHIKFHQEMREMPVYFLVVGENGPVFRETPAGADQRAMHGVEGRKQTLDLSHVSMETLAKDIHSYFFLDRPVIDKTGLTGLYDIRLAATPEFRLRDNSESGDIDIFRALQKQLGLKLESGKTEIKVMIVDHVEKPSAN